MRFKQFLTEGKATFFDLGKLKYFSLKTIKDLLDSYDFRNKRLALENGKVGGTQKDTKMFIKKLIQNDIDAGKELGIKKTIPERDNDYKYLKTIK